MGGIAGDNRYFSGFLDSLQGNKFMRGDNRAKHIIPHNTPNDQDRDLKTGFFPQNIINC
jgi:hypothetical protein